MILADGDRAFLETLVELPNCNPFEPRRLRLEQQALGDQFVVEDMVAWSLPESGEPERPNVQRLMQIAEPLLERMQSQLLKERAQPDQHTVDLYEGLVLYVLYCRHVGTLASDQLSLTARCDQKAVAAAWRNFAKQLQHYLGMDRFSFESLASAAHLFAVSCQVHRAFVNIFHCIVGDSLPAAQLRAAVWQSIFSHDFPRYRRSLFGRMRDVATLITGPSGSGKELVARAIGLSQYVPFDSVKSRFVVETNPSFLPVNLSAFSPTLIESELFGHCAGAFTGASDDRIGWLDSCSAHGAIFLDEIGDLDPLIQVKLLRVLQDRQFSRLGETVHRQFSGKIIAATNRDLAKEMATGKFRTDLYYRLCSDHIQTPSLAEHLHDRPAALDHMVRYVANRVAGAEEAAALAEEAKHVIATRLGPDYAWPGNFRELEQCVRNVLVRRDYVPSPLPSPSTGAGNREAWLDDARSGTLTHAQLTSRYCTWIYAQTGSYEKTAHRLGLDRRTVRAKIDEAWLAELHT